MAPGESAGQQSQQRRSKAQSLRLQAQAMNESADKLDRSADMWSRGYNGEQTVGAQLELLRPYGFDVLHDVRWPGRQRANIDHVAIGPPESSSSMRRTGRDRSPSARVSCGRTATSGPARSRVCDRLVVTSQASSRFPGHCTSSRSLDSQGSKCRCAPLPRRHSRWSPRARVLSHRIACSTHSRRRDRYRLASPVGAPLCDPAFAASCIPPPGTKCHGAPRTVGEGAEPTRQAEDRGKRGRGQARTHSGAHRGATEPSRLVDHSRRGRRHRRHSRSDLLRRKRSDSPCASDVCQLQRAACCISARSAASRRQELWDQDPAGRSS